MEDIYSAARDGNVRFVRQWLDNVENDLNQGDDHGFTPLHWACREGQMVIFEMLVARGGRLNAKNHGGDTPLHLASAHGRRDIVQKLLQHKATVNIMNEHGNTPLHYACFWNYEAIALELVGRGAYVSQCNKYDETPMERSKAQLGNIIKEKAKSVGQDLARIPFQEQEEGNFKASLEFLTLKSKNAGIDLEEIHLVEKISETLLGELHKGVWNNIPIVAKKLKIRGLQKRLNLHFCEEYPRLRIFSHPNVLPVVGAVTKSPNLMTISQYMPYGSLFDILHEGTGIVVDHLQSVKFAIDIAKGMVYLHSMDPLIPRLYLTSYHVMMDDDLTARICMADARFSFQDSTKIQKPNWMAPEILNNAPETCDQRAADMWSFAIILWELATREVPFTELSPMEMGMKIALEGLRPPLIPGMSNHLTKLINIAWNPDPAKRPRFDQLLPILQKMQT
ncbi:integrin-linked protein kinase-like isoform X2 [Rhopilema esculentum]|uniref:integrin-linked protein kinase-like isoform X1 n=1 Tax=Rhopilema esculentum TaxID=499914 RepID=UPI0031D79C72